MTSLVWSSHASCKSLGRQETHREVAIEGPVKLTCVDETNSSCSDLVDQTPDVSMVGLDRGQVCQCPGVGCMNESTFVEPSLMSS